MPQSDLGNDVHIAKLLREFGDLHVIDVGCSGGLAETWLKYAGLVRAIGIDPLVAEVDRLRAENQHVKHEYLCAYCSDAPGSEPFPQPVVSQDWFEHPPPQLRGTSALRACRLLELDHPRENFNQGEELVTGTISTTVDEIVRDAGWRHVDVLKVDTDGFDDAVLAGAKDLLARKAVSVVQVELSYDWTASSSADRADQLLRDNGYILIRTEPQVYSMDALPAPFQYDMFTQTTSGVVRWADAIYALPPNARDHADDCLARLVAVFVALNLNDLAADVIVRHDLRNKQPGSPWDSILDSLTPGDTSYDEYLAEFCADPTQWLPGGIHGIAREGAAAINAADVADCTPNVARILGLEAGAYGQPFTDNGAGGVTIQTPSDSWSYGGVVRLQTPAALPTELAVTLSVTGNRVGVATLRSRDEIATEVPVDPCSPQRVLLPVSSRDDLWGIVVRTYDRPGKAHVVLQEINFLMPTGCEAYPTDFTTLPAAGPAENGVRAGLRGMFGGGKKR